MGGGRKGRWEKEGSGGRKERKKIGKEKLKGNGEKGEGSNGEDKEGGKKKEKDGKETLKGEGSKERVEVMRAGKEKERTQGVWRG